jgi:MYXO-CTERM domain-containing protein
VRYAVSVRSGLARCFAAALISVVAGCDPLSYGEQVQLALGDGGIVVDDALVSFDDAPPPPVDAPVEGPADAHVEGPGPDAMVDAMPDAMVDAMVDAMPDAMVDAMPDAMVDAMPDAMVDAAPMPMPDAMIDAAPMPMPDAAVDAMPTDGGPGDGSLTDALAPDGRGPGFPVGGSNDDEIQSFYACSTGEGASALPLLLAILALRRRRR